MKQYREFMKTSIRSKKFESAEWAITMCHDDQSSHQAIVLLSLELYNLNAK